MKKVYMHYCTKKGCFPPLFYDFSSEPVPCPDCGTLSRRATLEERHRRDVVDHPSGMMEAAFFIAIWKKSLRKAKYNLTRARNLRKELE